MSRPGGSPGAPTRGVRRGSLRSSKETADARTLVLDGTGLARSHRGATRRRAAHRSRRLLGDAQLLAVVRARGSRPRSPCRRSMTARSRPTSCATSRSATCSSCGGPVGGYFVWTGAPPAPCSSWGVGRGLPRCGPCGGPPIPPRRVVVVASESGCRAACFFAGELAERVAHRRGPPPCTSPAPPCPRMPCARVRPSSAVTLRPGRVDAASVQARADRLRVARRPTRPCSSCGPTSFVEAVIDLLADAGLDPRTVRAERFG